MKLTLLVTAFSSLALSSPIATPQSLIPSPTAEEKHAFILSRCQQYRTAKSMGRYTKCTEAALNEWNSIYPPQPTSQPQPQANLNNRCAEACNLGRDAMLDFCSSGAYWDKSQNEVNNCFKRAHELSGSQRVPNSDGVTWGQVNCWDHCIKNFGRANYGP